MNPNKTCHVSVCPVFRSVGPSVIISKKPGGYISMLLSEPLYTSMLIIFSCGGAYLEYIHEYIIQNHIKNDGWMWCSKAICKYKMVYHPIMFTFFNRTGRWWWGVQRFGFWRRRYCSYPERAQGVTATLSAPVNLWR